jgi:hypothetical protein
MNVLNSVELAYDIIPHRKDFESVNTIPKIIYVMAKTSCRALCDFQSSREESYSHEHD